MGRIQRSTKLTIFGGSTFAAILAIVVAVWAPTSAVPTLVTLVSATGLTAFCAWAVVSLDRGQH